MSQALEEEIISSNSDAGTKFGFRVEVSIESTETKESETNVFSLGHPKNESLEDFDKEMEQISNNSLENWKD